MAKTSKNTQVDNRLWESNKSVRDKFIALAAELGSAVLERATAIKLLLLAILTGEHYLQLGAPGCAKSLLVRELRKRIASCGYFELLLTAFTPPDEVFGPIDLNAYAAGQQKRIRSGSLSEAHLGFLDEIFKANSAILNSLLTIANERLIHEIGHAPCRVPLLSLFAASNETPQDESLAALSDRFLLKQVVSAVVEESSFEALVTGNVGAPVTVQLTLDEITQAQAEVGLVGFSAEAIASLKVLRVKLQQQGIAVSDRKWFQIGKLLRAQAWLDGDAEVQVETIEVLTHALWAQPKEVRTVERTVLEVSNPLHLRAVEIEDQAREIFEKAPKPGDHNFTGQIENVLQQLVDIHSQLADSIDESSAKNKTRAEESLAKVAGWHKEIGKLAFKELSKLQLKGL